MAETLSNGVVIPQGTDLIHGSGVQAMRNLGGSVNTALTGKANTAHTHPDLVSRLAALEYTTGLRNVTSLVVPEWTTISSVTLLRVGGFVAVWLVGFTKGEDLTGTHGVMTLPPGFRPPDTTWAKSYRGKDIRVLTNGAVQVINPSRSTDNGYFFYPTLEAPPETPPGT